MVLWLIMVIQRNNWIWPKEQLTDVRESKYWKYIQKLQEVSKEVYKEKD
mgnify:CR=1 FL=1